MGLSADQPIADLTAAMARGDQEAVATFYRRYFDLLYTQARRAARRDEAFCLDVVQEAVLRIIRSIRKADSEAQLMAWLKLVVRTAAYDLLKSERRRKVREAVTVPVASQRLETDDDRIEALRGEISALDPQLARMLEMRYGDDWTLASVAEFFGLSVGAVDGRLRRALRVLRQRVTEADNGSMA